MLAETELQVLIDAIEITGKNGMRWHLETSSITRSLYSDDQSARLIDFQILRAGEEMSGRVRLGSIAANGNSATCCPGSRGQS